MPYRTWITMSSPTHVIFRFHLPLSCKIPLSLFKENDDMQQVFSRGARCKHSVARRPQAELCMYRYAPFLRLCKETKKVCAIDNFFSPLPPIAATHITLINSYWKALKKKDKRKMPAALHCPLISEPYRSPFCHPLIRKWIFTLRIINDTDRTCFVCTVKGTLEIFYIFTVKGKGLLRM